MGPKKEAKKKGGGKAEGPITVDPLDFLREETDLQVLGGVSTLDTTLSGDILNVEELFPEWNDEEVWTDVPEALKSFQVAYPKIIKYSEEKSPAQLLGLPTELDSENKKGSKKPPKEFALDDAKSNEEGIPLPRVFIGSDAEDEFLSSELKISFLKHWTSDQLERKAAMEAAYRASLPPAPVTEPPPSSASGARAKESARPMSKDGKKQVSAAATKKSEPEDPVAPVIPDPPKFPEQPNGDEVDPLLCHVFRLIARFYPSLCDPLGRSPAPYLWRAVYPQLPSGKPCYNKCGKYCVKLFLGGKWRKVTVTDTFPVENGVRAVASSDNPLELWPSILAKAIYTAFTASGYQHTLNDLSSHRSNPSAVSSFISFSLHVLTGWLPSTPFSLKELCALNSSRLQTILDEISLGGAVVVNASDIPSEEAIVMRSDEDNQNRQRTKKQLRDLLLRKKMEKENLIEDIHSRERVIQTIDGALSRPFGEVYFLHGISPPDSEEGDQILPVLGICHPDPMDSRMTMFLTTWMTSPIIFSQTPVAEDIPGSTPVRYEWISLADLCLRYQQVFICSFDTRLRTPYSAECSWHWGDLVEKVEDPKAKGKKESKGKEKKTEVSQPTLGVPSRGQDRGVFPPFLMKIDPQSLAETSAASSEYFSLSVNLQSDLVLLPQPSDDQEPNEPVTNSFGVIDDSVLVIQEIRTDSLEPLVMRVQLAKEDLCFPINRVTFNIPLQRLPQEPVLFWVRLFTKSSVFFSFHAPVPIEVMDAKTTWQSTGGVVWELTSTTLPTYAKSEQLLFRIPLQLTSPPSESMEAGTVLVPQDDSVLVFLHTSNRAITDTISLVAIDHLTGHSRVLPTISGNCFHLASNQQVTLVARCFHTSLNIPEFSWKATLLSRRPLVPPESKIGSCLVATEKGSKQRYFGSYAANNQLRIFRDVLTAEITDFPLALRLSCLPLVDEDERINFRTEESKAEVAEHLWFIARIYRRSDRQLIHEYSARSLLQIYLLNRDGLTPEGDGEDPMAATASDKKSAKSSKTEKKKKGEVEAVDFILDVVLDPTRMRIPPDWKSRFPFKFRKYQSRSELGAMDEKLNESVGGVADGGGAPSEMQFHWQLDVLAGKILKMQHDTFDLERYAALKNKWEEEAPGRRARALTARSYWNTRREAGASESREQYNDSVIEKLATDLSEALEKDETAIAVKERQLRFLPQYREHQVAESESKELVSENILLEEKAYLSAEIQRWEETASHHSDLLKKFNESFREDALSRIKLIHEQTSWSYEEAIQTWAQREAYRANVEKKNESLNYLLQRATEALITAFPGDFEDPKAKKKGKK